MQDFNVLVYLSHCLSVHDAMIQRETMKTKRTVPGHIVIKVLKTNLRVRKNIDIDVKWVAARKVVS